jgi:hypothetical protein
VLPVPKHVLLVLPDSNGRQREPLVKDPPVPRRGRPLPLGLEQWGPLATEGQRKSMCQGWPLRSSPRDSAGRRSRAPFKRRRSLLLLMWIHRAKWRPILHNAHHRRGRVRGRRRESSMFGALFLLPPLLRLLLSSLRLLLQLLLLSVVLHSSLCVAATVFAVALHTASVTSAAVAAAAAAVAAAALLTASAASADATGDDTDRPTQSSPSASQCGSKI